MGRILSTKVLFRLGLCSQPLKRSCSDFLVSKEQSGVNIVVSILFTAGRHREKPWELGMC